MVTRTAAAACRELERFGASPSWGRIFSSSARCPLSFGTEGVRLGYLWPLACGAHAREAVPGIAQEQQPRPKGRTASASWTAARSS